MNAFSLTRATTLFAAIAAAILGGCGGGDDTTTPTSTSTPVISAADYLHAGMVSTDTTAGQTLVLVDAAQPVAPRITLPLSATDLFIKSRAVQTNKAAGTFTVVDATVGHVMRNGRLYRLSLKKSDATTLQQVSSVATGCSFELRHFLVVSPTLSGVIPVTEAGPDQLCGTTDDRKVHVLPNATATSAPVVLPVGVELLTPLLDATLNNTLGFLAKDSRGGAAAKLTLYNRDLTLIGDVAGGGGITAVSLPGARLIDTMWLRVNNQLKQLNWTATGATLSSTSLYTFTGTESPFMLFGDSSGLYFVDGQKVVRVPGSGAAQTLATFTSAQGTPSLSGMSAGHLIVHGETESPTFSRLLYALPTSGGTLRALSPLGEQAAFQGTWGNTVYFSVFHSLTVAGRNNDYHSVHRVNLDGTQPITVTPFASSAPQVVTKRTLRLGADNDLEGLMWCEPAAGFSSTCANGILKTLNPSTGITTLLGSLSRADAYATWNVYDSATMSAGAPVLLQATGRLLTSVGAREKELFLIRFGETGSLTKLNVTP
ncbi:MAG: hypothetical protein RLZZ618_3062 [Pseudomonadota bacterium]|jgi:hypothetical protein